MELRLFLSEAPLKFVEPTIAPAVAPDSRPWLLSVSDLILKARAGAFKGTFSNENASITVDLDNSKKQAASLIGRPMRARAEVWDDSRLYFAGVVQAIGYGTSVTLAIEA